jgi:hypothetical protein
VTRQPDPASCRRRSSRASIVSSRPSRRSTRSIGTSHACDCRRVRIFGPGGYNGARPDRQSRAIGIHARRSEQRQRSGSLAAACARRRSRAQRSDCRIGDRNERDVDRRHGHRAAFARESRVPGTRRRSRRCARSQDRLHRRGTRRIQGVGSRGPERFLRATGPRAARGPESRRRDRRPPLHRAARRRSRDAIPADRRRSAVDAVDAVRQRDARRRRADGYRLAARSATTSRISIPATTASHGMRTWTFVPARGAETGSWRVLHVYRQMRAGQIRGVPMLATVMEQLKQLSRLSEAELMASVVNSLFTVFVKSESGDMPLQDMQTGRARRCAESASTRFRRSGAEPRQRPGCRSASRRRHRRRRSEAPERAVRSVLRSDRRSDRRGRWDIPGSVLLKRFDASYSAARAELLEFWRVVLTRRKWLVRDMCAPCREAVIEEAVARG